jgi:hypothetical protein
MKSNHGMDRTACPTRPRTIAARTTEGMDVFFGDGGFHG